MPPLTHCSRTHCGTTSSYDIDPDQEFAAIGAANIALARAFLSYAAPDGALAFEKSQGNDMVVAREAQ